MLFCNLLQAAEQLVFQHWPPTPDENIALMKHMYWLGFCSTPQSYWKVSSNFDIALSKRLALHKGVKYDENFKSQSYLRKLHPLQYHSFNATALRHLVQGVHRVD